MRKTIFTFHRLLSLGFAAVLALGLLCPPAMAEADAPAASGYFLTAEYSRLYFAPADGSPLRLVCDGETIVTERWGESLYASFADGSIRRYSLDGSNETLLAPASPRSYRRLIPFDGGVIGMYFSMIEGAGCDLYREGTLTPTELFPLEGVPSSLTAGKHLYACRYDHDDIALLSAYDTDSLDKLWELEVDSSAELHRTEEGILCFLPNRGKLYALDEDLPALVPVDIPLKDTDCELVLRSGETCLVQGNWSDQYRNYLIRNGIRTQVEEGLPEYFSLVDMNDGKALLKSYKSWESEAGENAWYSAETYTLLDTESGTISDFPVRGQYGSLFAGGDFPLMDSSTARKPVTAELYAFFCEGTGAGGKLPLCSTTHGAWLNIADRKADVALLAAPTEEEQAYLDEKNVTVERKLYGGDGLVFIGNRACGVEDLSLDQLKAIYRGEITSWAELGGEDHAIRVLYRDDQSGSQRLFERMLWKDEAVPDFAALGFDCLSDMSTIVSECLRDPYAIGYSIMTYLHDVFGKEDLLAFSLNGYAATPENVASRNYPLGTQGYVVIRSDEPENSPARRLYDFFGSPLSDVILTRNGITPLHEQADSVLSSAGEKDTDTERTARDIIEELAVCYGTYGSEAEQELDDLLAELSVTDPVQGAKWKSIVDLWKTVNSDFAVNEGILPDGLPETDELCMVVLGFQLNPDGSMKDELIERLKVALASAEKYPNAFVVCTGGGTAAENRTATEAGEMAKWLIGNGLDPQRVIVEDQSLTTAQNAHFTCQILSEQFPQVRKLAIISSDYHISTGTLLFGAETILQAEEPGRERISVVSNAAYPAPSGTLPQLFQAGALLELSGDVETAFNIYYDTYHIHDLPQRSD